MSFLNLMGNKLKAKEVNDALEKLTPSKVNANEVNYDNTTSGLTANDVQDAIDEISRGKIQVIADGVKTYGELLDSIISLLDFSKIRTTSAFIFNDTVRDYIFQIHFNRSNANVQFSRVTIGMVDTNYVARIENVRIDTTASSAFELLGTTYTDNTNNVVPENNTLTLVY